MSVYPEFLEHIHNEGLYVPGYNYEEMYNIMVDALMNNKDSSNNFIYTHQQVTNLYEVLEEFLYPTEMTDVEETETNEPPILPNTNHTNQTALQAFNNYIITAMNNSNQNQNNNNNHNLYNLNYNNIVYYNNT
jgi:hypothetical protein